MCRLEGLLDFNSSGAIVSWLPLFLFTVLFGLSMDYHVFILSRIKELVDEGVPNNEAVERGIRSTASTVTSAAAVMIAVFAIFASLRVLDIKQLGVGLAIAVFLDATLIRGVLLPATMKLLGDWNWYLPRWLEWMPRIGADSQAKPFASNWFAKIVCASPTGVRLRRPAGRSRPVPDLSAGARGRRPRSRRA